MDRRSAGRRAAAGITTAVGVVSLAVTGLVSGFLFAGTNGTATTSGTGTTSSTGGSSSSTDSGSSSDDSGSGIQQSQGGGFSGHSSGS